MRPSVLLLVHVEEEYRRLFRPDYLECILAAVRSGKYDTVVHITSMTMYYSPVQEIVPVVDREIIMAFGYQFSCSQCKVCNCTGPLDCNAWDYEDKFTHRSHYSPERVVWIPPEFRGNYVDYWRNTDVFLGGGIQGLCLADMQTVLEIQKIPYTIVPELTYKLPGG